MSNDEYLRDVHEIRNLKHTYCELADRCCSSPDARLAADEIIQLFVEDGELEVPTEYGGRQVGRAGIHAFWMQQSVVFSFADHLVFNERIDVNGFEARGRWKNAIPATIFIDDKPVELTPKEFDLLAFLAASPRQLFSRGQLLEQVWDSSSEWQDPSTVTVHIRRLRQKIEEDPERPRWITTTWGVGYRFEP